MKIAIIFAALICAVAAQHWPAAKNIGPHHTWTGQWNGAPSHVWTAPAVTTYAAHAPAAWTSHWNGISPAWNGISPAWNGQHAVVYGR